MPFVPAIDNQLLIPYANKSGKSGVRYYGTLGEHEDVFLVVFHDQSAYAYARHFIGAQAMEDMQALAVQGEGLATYIAQHRPNGMKIHLVFGLGGNGHG